MIVEGAVRAGDTPYSTVELRNGDSIQFLQPGLPTEVAYIWQVGVGSVAPGDRIVLGIFERYDFVDDPRYDDSKTDPVPVVRLVETVGERR